MVPGVQHFDIASAAGDDWQLAEGAETYDCTSVTRVYVPDLEQYVARGQEPTGYIVLANA